MSAFEGFISSSLPRLLSEMKSGGTPSTSRSDFYGGSIPFVAIDDLTSSHKYIEKARKSLSAAGLKGSNAWLVPPGAILYSIYATLGVPRINLVPVATNQAILAMLCDETKVDVDYLYYWLTYIRSSVINFSSQTTQSNLSSTIVKSFEVEHPESLPEQAKIAEVLSTVDRGIEQTEALIAKQQRIKTGLMADLLTRGIDEHGNLRSEATHAFKDSPLGRIPVEWEVKTLGATSHISSGITLGNIPDSADSVELPYLRVANVQDGYLDLSTVTTIRVPGSYLARFELKVGDVLMNEGGDFDKLGRGTIWRGEIEQCLHQNHVFKVRPQDGVLQSEYLAYVSASPYGKAFFVRASKQSTNLASINSTQLKSFPLPLPDFDEQTRIYNTIDRGDRVLAEHQLYLKKLRSLKTGLMQDLLTGKKRVTELLDAEVAG
jgi:type I restriction enzyme S subunit